MDKKSGSTTDRPGLRALLGYARDGDVIVVHTLDRLGRIVRDTLNLIHDLSTRGVGVRNLADPIRIDSSDPDDPMAQLEVVLLALFGQMERTYTLERAAHAQKLREYQDEKHLVRVLLDVRDEEGHTAPYQGGDRARPELVLGPDGRIASATGMPAATDIDKPVIFVSYFHRGDANQRRRFEIEFGPAYRTVSMK